MHVKTVFVGLKRKKCVAYPQEDFLFIKLKTCLRISLPKNCIRFLLQAYLNFTFLGSHDFRLHFRPHKVYFKFRFRALRAYFHLFDSQKYIFLLHIKFPIDGYYTRPYWFWSSNSVFRLWGFIFTLLTPERILFLAPYKITNRWIYHTTILFLEPKFRFWALRALKLSFIEYSRSF
jgi:hypothetical protein